VSGCDRLKQQSALQIQAVLLVFAGWVESC